MKAPYTWISLSLYLLIIWSLAIQSASAAESHIVSFKIRQGYGAGELLQEITSQSLEGFRVEGQNTLRLGVDVNEAANGTEKASSQAVAVESVRLDIEWPSGEHSIYTDFTTPTQALLAAEGQTTRQLYYTLLGDTGSNRITPNQIQTLFDSVIDLRVPDDLSQAVSAHLEIQLLTVNDALGDPEAFYDYSNGFEDLALLNHDDSQYILALNAGQDEAPAVIQTTPTINPNEVVESWIYYPSSTDYYYVTYEDNFPKQGDYDFNDLVVAYQVRFGVNSQNEVVKLKGVAYLIARGAHYDHDWYLKIQLPPGASGDVSYQWNITQETPSSEILSESASFQDELNLKLFDHTLNSFKAQVSGEKFTNTEWDGISNPIGEFEAGPRSLFEATPNSPLPLDAIEMSPFDPYLFVYNTGYEIHLPDKMANLNSKNTRNGVTAFKDEQGYPYAMYIPNEWQFPFEDVNLGYAYPDFLDFVISSGQHKQAWYLNPTPGKVRAYQRQQWKWE